MLSPADAALVARDPAIPGLAVLLDDEAFAVVLRTTTSAPVTTAWARYVRYKPGTSCLVAYTVVVDGVEIDVYAHAYAKDERDKLAKVHSQNCVDSSLGAGCFTLDDLKIAAYIMPNDRKLDALARLGPDRRQLLRRLLPEQPAFWSATVRRLRYKPERRYVAQLCTARDERAALKLYTGSDYRVARRGVKSFQGTSLLRLPRLLGHSDRHRALVFEWLPGLPLTTLLQAPAYPDELPERVGGALVELHRQPAGKLKSQQHMPAAPLDAAAEAIGAVCDDLGDRARRLAVDLAAELGSASIPTCPVHGDFYSDQVLLDGGRVAILDLDQSGWGDPAADLGSFAAHLLRHALRGELPLDRATAASGALAAGYRKQLAQLGASADGNLQARIVAYTAAGLLRLAAEPFRYREPDWYGRMQALLEQAEEVARRRDVYV